MTLVALPWIVLFLPLAATVLITLFTHKDRKLSAGLSIGAVVAGFILSVIFVGSNGWGPARESAATWLWVGNFHVDFGLRFEPLSLLMMLIVTGVGSVIHIYSWGYMHGDAGFSRFFACLSLFTFSMLGIVLANNFLELFIFWELVGVSSYLLIGFWFERPAAADAGKKAFLTNRLGDFGFLLGILTVWGVLGSLNFSVLEATMLANPQALGTVATVAGLLIFCGAVGKSAQFPLHVWLPDAMEGPTPVSALIHAATMVAAGVYMLCRVYFLLNSPALEVISWIGGITALMAALIAVQQNDIKRILAYSTLSQLGYMVLGVGLHGPREAMFHLSTHAFFKALLFLGAGSVILALHHEQDIWRMGGLRKRMPVTFWTFLVGTLALAGMVPFSGFYSKDAILGLALERHAYGRFLLGVVVAVLTTFYMFRLVLVVFGQSSRAKTAGHAQESPPVILNPLRLLAAFSLVGGFIGIENIYASSSEGSQALTSFQQFIGPFAASPGAAVIGLLAVGLGFFGAYRLYAHAASDPLPAKLGAAARWMRDRFYFDELYEATVIRAHDFVATVADWLDRWIISGLAVRGLHGTTEIVGRMLREVQTGNLQTYAFLFALGVALVLFFMLR
ncbi:MAG TPA: NADH-quinone oxidoreductase subunit L [Patescibacteria group bacterium]|nr:NADH-quinone oxidoreductase subunit L [Patescibacteria group bacterium]